MRKVIDDRGRLFGKVSIIDVIVLLAVILLAVLLLRDINIRDLPLITSNPTKVTYEVRVQKIRDTNANLIRVGDKLYAGVDVPVGVITSVVVSDAWSAEALIDGTIVMGQSHERYDLLLTVEVECSHNNDEYYIGRNFKLKLNKEFGFYTKYNTFIGTIMAVNAR